VAALAFPLLQTSARIEEDECCKCRCESVMGAATQRFRVKSAAAVAGSSVTRAIKSFLLLYLILAETAPAKKPWGQNPFEPSDAEAIGVTEDGQRVMAES